MKQTASPTPQIQLKAYSIKEMAQFYGICERTMKSWLTPYQQEIGLKLGRFYTPRQVKIIFDKLGIPETMEFS